MARAEKPPPPASRCAPGLEHLNRQRDHRNHVSELLLLAALELTVLGAMLTALSRYL